MFKFKAIFFVIFLIGFQFVNLSFAADFDKWDKWDKWDRMDNMDKKKFNKLIEEARSCADDWEFSCARSKLNKAKQYIVDMKDEDRLANAWDYYEQEQEEQEEYKKRQRRERRQRRAERESKRICDSSKVNVEYNSEREGYEVFCGNFDILGFFWDNHGWEARCTGDPAMQYHTLDYDASKEDALRWVIENCPPR